MRPTTSRYDPQLQRVSLAASSSPAAIRTKEPSGERSSRCATPASASCSIHRARRRQPVGRLPGRLRGQPARHALREPRRAGRRTISENDVLQQPYVPDPATRICPLKPVVDLLAGKRSTSSAGRTITRLLALGLPNQISSRTTQFRVARALAPAARSPSTSRSRRDGPCSATPRFPTAGGGRFCVNGGRASRRRATRSRSPRRCRSGVGHHPPVQRERLRAGAGAVHRTTPSGGAFP